MKTFAGTNTSQDHVEDIQKEEFNLSKKIFRSEILAEALKLIEGLETKDRENFFFAEDVKEFIKLLKEDFNKKPYINTELLSQAICSRIDKLAGSKLLEGGKDIKW